MFRLTHAALAASIVVYGMVTFILSGSWSRPEAIEARAARGADSGDTILYVLAAAALVDLLAIPLLRRLRMPPRTTAPEDRLGDVDLTAPEAARGALGKLLSASILSWALCEAIAIFGLVASFVAQEGWRFWPFGVVALGAILAYAPRKADYRAVIRAATGA